MRRSPSVARTIAAGKLPLPPMPATPQTRERHSQAASAAAAAAAAASAASAPPVLAAQTEVPSHALPRRPSHKPVTPSSWWMSPASVTSAREEEGDDDDDGGRRRGRRGGAEGEEEDDDEEAAQLDVLAGMHADFAALMRAVSIWRMHGLLSPVTTAIPGQPASRAAAAPHAGTGGSSAACEPQHSAVAVAPSLVIHSRRRAPCTIARRAHHAHRGETAATVAIRQPQPFLPILHLHRGARPFSAFFPTRIAPVPSLTRVPAFCAGRVCGACLALF